MIFRRSDSSNPTPAYVFLVQAGESFDAIATAYGTRWTQIYAANSVPVHPPPER